MSPRRADGSGLIDRVVVDECAFDFRGADLATSDVQRVVGAAVEEPKAILVLLRPVAVVPQPIPGRPVLLEIALIARPQALGHRGTGVSSDQKAAFVVVFDGVARGVDDVDVHAESRGDGPEPEPTEYTLELLAEQTVNHAHACTHGDYDDRTSLDAGDEPDETVVSDDHVIWAVTYEGSEGYVTFDTTAHQYDGPFVFYMADGSVDPRSARASFVPTHRRATATRPRSSSSSARASRLPATPWT